jgi:hypothetical protein
VEENIDPLLTDLSQAFIGISDCIQGVLLVHLASQHVFICRGLEAVRIV